MDSSSVCGFCQGKPVINAAVWWSDRETEYLPCPRCGEVNEPNENPSYGPGNPDWERDFEKTR